MEEKQRKRHEGSDMKYKVGDRVRIKSYIDLKNNYAADNYGNIYFYRKEQDGRVQKLGIYFSTFMYKYCSREMVVKTADTQSYKLSFISTGNCLDYSFVDEMLEPPIDPIVVNTDYKYNEELL